MEKGREGERQGQNFTKIFFIMLMILNKIKNYLFKY